MPSGSTSSKASTVIFADTGIQLLAFPLKVAYKRQQTGKIGQWQRCRCRVGGSIKEFHYIQWQVIDGVRLILAVDTTLGPDKQNTSAGFFSNKGVFAEPCQVNLQGLVGADGSELEKLPPIEFQIQATDQEQGEELAVDLVLDFGNNRTGALLVKFQDKVARYDPLPLINRYNLDCWDENGLVKQDPQTWWFSSRAVWSAEPYASPPKLETDEIVQEKTPGLFGKKEVSRKVTKIVNPLIFQDFSQARIGREASSLILSMKNAGQELSSLSSPKRYLWANISHLQRRKWWMADPRNPPEYVSLLKGPFLKCLTETDTEDEFSQENEENPIKPSYPPRALMMAALYEIIVQAYSYINSPSYRSKTGADSRLHYINSLSMTYPSGMLLEEQGQLRRQAERALKFFSCTVGKKQHSQPEFHLGVDEATAAQLTYIYSEIEKTGRQATIWFTVTARNKQAEETNIASMQLKSSKQASSNTEYPPLTIASIDIGGGTSDLMIAKYDLSWKVGGGRITGNTLHRDGVSTAGDELVKRILERIIVPKIRESLNMPESDAQKLFVGNPNDNLREKRIIWMNQFLVPLANAYLDNAAKNDEDTPINYHDDDVYQEPLNRLQQAAYEHCEKEYIFKQSLNLFYDGEEFQKTVRETFEEILTDFCSSIVHHDVDIVLLAGLPTKLNAIRKMVLQRIPLPESRVISMYNRFVGKWYPYFNESNPGVIADPKSAVVVGAAIERLTRLGQLGKFVLDMNSFSSQESFYWGVMNGNRINSENIFFKPSSKENTVNEFTFEPLNRRYLIGKKRGAHDSSYASPVFEIDIPLPLDRKGSPLKNVSIRLERYRTPKEEGSEELIKPVGENPCSGEIDGEPAELGKNIFFGLRTLPGGREDDDEFFLDSGSLSTIG